MPTQYAAAWAFFTLFAGLVWGYRAGKLAGLIARSLANTTLVFELRAQGKLTMGEAKSLLSQPDEGWWWS